jgi:hypothetical protein
VLEPCMQRGHETAHVGCIEGHNSWSTLKACQGDP